MAHDNCKFCKLKPVACICDDVDAFFSDTWHLMHDWTAQVEYQEAYAAKKDFAVTVSRDL